MKKKFSTAQTATILVPPSISTPASTTRSHCCTCGATPQRAVAVPTLVKKEAKGVNNGYHQSAAEHVNDKVVRRGRLSANLDKRVRKMHFGELLAGLFIKFVKKIPKYRVYRHYSVDTIFKKNKFRLCALVRKQQGCSGTQHWCSAKRSSENTKHIFYHCKLGSPKGIKKINWPRHTGNDQGKQKFTLYVEWTKSICEPMWKKRPSEMKHKREKMELTKWTGVWCCTNANYAQIQRVKIKLQ